MATLNQVARELANPNNSLASLTFENKFRRNTPVKFEPYLNDWVDQPDAFDPEWRTGLKITPVVPSFINNWIRGD